MDERQANDAEITDGNQVKIPFHSVCSGNSSGTGLRSIYVFSDNVCQCLVFVQDLLDDLRLGSGDKIFAYCRVMSIM